MRKWTSVAPASRIICTILRDVVPRTIEVVDQHDAFAGDDGAVGGVLEADALVADRLRRLDEGAADIVIADDAELVGDARFLRIAERGRHAGVRHRHDHVGRRRALRAPVRRPASCARCRRCGRRRWNRAGRNRCTRRCRAATARGGNGLCDCAPSSSNTTTSPFSTSRTYCAPMMSRAQVSDARIGQPSRLPITSGRMPSGSRAPTSFLLVRPTKA